MLGLRGRLALLCRADRHADELSGALVAYSCWLLGTERFQERGAWPLEVPAHRLTVSPKSVAVMLCSRTFLGVV